MNDPVWQPVRAELDRWASEGRRVDLWLRDDDAASPSPALDRLAGLAEHFRVPVLLAVVPFQAEPALAERLGRAPLLLPCQHGAWHRNHAPPDQKKCEVGSHRPQAKVMAELAAARQRLHDLFGTSLLPIFVPPWNRIAGEIVMALPELGFSGLSCFRKFRLPAGGGPVLVNSEVDIIDWHGGRIGRSAPALAEEIARLLAERRGESSGNTALGLLLHHRDHDATAWSVLDTLLRAIAGHPAIRLADPRQLFLPPIAA